MIISSSYVLIITTPFVRPPKQVEAALPVAWVNTFNKFYELANLVKFVFCILITVKVGGEGGWFVVIKIIQRKTQYTGYRF